MTIARIVLITMLLASSTASAQDRSSVVLTTKHFAFHSDIATNVHDALITAATARRAKQPELFATGAEKACFDGLPAAHRSQWARAVDYYTAGKSTNLQRLLMRFDLAGFLRRDLYSLKLFGGPFLDAAARMPQAAEDLIRALAMQ
ncbi:MAG: hypothetical protein DMF90_09435 [Acidobacteria bacterium]|nr:MAG: hypothetical protein DMF90_09435 [Acidobacteriota bacterium]